MFKEILISSASIFYLGEIKMGGKKKVSLKKMERMQQRKGKAERAKQRRVLASAEKGSTRIIPPQFDDKNVMKEIKRMKVLTPYTISSRFDLRLSVAKDFLEELHQRGVVTYVSGGRNIKIYKPTD